uniref:Uncharacterized protein n=1 Tax=Ignisphaera aggregans TaxID=334771 RepID=A0A7J3QDB7_9CREN
MTLEKVIRVIGYYNDASYIERVIATFRKLLIDVEWIWGRRINDVYEIYLGVKDHPNLKLAILNLSKTVGIESVELLIDAKVEKYVYINGDFKKIDKTANENINNSIIKYFTIYIPIYTRIAGYRWGEKYGEDI